MLAENNQHGGWETVNNLNAKWLFYLTYIYLHDDWMICIKCLLKYLVDLYYTSVHTLATIPMPFWPHNNTRPRNNLESLHPICQIDQSEYFFQTIAKNEPLVLYSTSTLFSKITVIPTLHINFDTILDY